MHRATNYYFCVYRFEEWKKWSSKKTNRLGTTAQPFRWLNLYVFINPYSNHNNIKENYNSVHTLLDFLKL